MSAALEIHSRFVQSTLRRFLWRLWPGARALPPVSIEVLSGLHQGSKATFDGAAITVGPDADFDVMLIDDDLADGWLIISLEMSIFGPLMSIEAQHDRVSVGKVPIANLASSDPVGLPCTVRVGGVSIEVADAGEDQQSFGHRSTMVAIPLLFSAGLAVLGFMLFQEYETRSPVELVTLEAALTDPQNEGRASAETVVRDVVTEAGLQKYLTVTKNASANAVYVSGTVPAKLIPQWQRARVTIDAQTLDDVVITQVVPSVAISGLPAVAAVRLGAIPQVILANGLKIGVGQSIKDDWLIVAITDQKMTLRRDTEVVEIEF